MATLAVLQMTSTDDVEKNLSIVGGLIERAAARGASVVVVPECFAFLGEHDGDVLRVAEPLTGPLFARYRALAKQHGVVVCYGGFPERVEGAEKTFNAHVVVDEQGEIRAHYRKIHLFDLDIEGGPRLLESKATAPGDRLVTTSSPVGTLGLAVCYDLRFAELFLGYRRAGADVILVPAAFTLTTGKEHWEVLLRARAIETQCYVAAAAQRGRHNAKRESFGHAMIVDPWGSVVAQCHDDTGLAIAEIDPAWTKSVRARLPVMEHRRPAAYERSTHEG